MDIDNIDCWQCPHLMQRDLFLARVMNNEKPQTPSIDTYHHGDLRRALIQAALRAGVSHNAPYNHFPHKRDLLDAAATAGHDLLRSELTAAVAKIADPHAALSKMGSAYVSFGIRNPALYHLMFRVGPIRADWHRGEILTAWVESRAVLESILRRGARIGAF